MAVRHPVLVDAATLCQDAYMHDVLFGLAYGMYPMCVCEGGTPDTVLFRRSVGPTEKDRAARLAAAAADLQADAEIVAYNATTTTPLHVHAATLSVTWDVSPSGVDPAVHGRVIPALLQWTRWEREVPWATLRHRLAMAAAAPANADQHPVPRALRMAQVLDVVGRSGGDCRRAMALFSTGSLQITYDPNSGDVVTVTGL